MCPSPPRNTTPLARRLPLLLTDPLRADIGGLPDAPGPVCTVVSGQSAYRTEVLARRGGCGARPSIAGRDFTMTEPPDFRQLLQRVRDGHPDAATELVRLYEPEIRRAVHLRLTDPRLRRLIDSMDVCQSVLANFFVHAALGQYQFESPEQLLHFLVTMARNRVRDHARRQHRARRDQRRQVAGDEALAAAPGDDLTPSRIVEGQELLEAVRQRLSPEERYLAEQRSQGRNWADLAAEQGQSAEALRKRLGRAISRALEDLGLKDGCHV
jgi:RNA polymerase sigma factor (sigma-70 family)